MEICLFITAIGCLPCISLCTNNPENEINHNEHIRKTNPKFKSEQIRQKNYSTGRNELKTNYKMYG